MKENYHIIWNIFGVYPLWDERGDWDEIKEKYFILKENKVKIELEKEFPKNYKKNNVFLEVKEFNDDQKAFLKRQINDLTKINGDRISGGLEIFYLNIEKTYIELIIREERNILKQKISRLKSRLGALLSFEYSPIFNGKNTWGKGIWISKICNNQNKAIQIIKRC